MPTSAAAIQPELFCHRFGSAFIIAGCHHDFDAELVKVGDGFTRGFFYRVGDREQTGCATIDSDEENSLSLRLQIRRARS